MIQRKITTALSLMLLLAASCDDYTPPTAPSHSVTALIVSDTLLPADGHARTLVIASTTPKETRSSSLVRFQASKSILQPGDTNEVFVPVAVDGTAAITIKAPRQAGLVVLTASLAAAIERTDSVMFFHACPDEISLEPMVFGIEASPTATVTVTAYLRRHAGDVTPGTRATFAAMAEVDDSTTAAGDTVGQFGAPGLSDTNGHVQVKYTPGITPYRGPVVITGEACGSKTDAVIGRTRLFIIPKSQ